MNLMSVTRVNNQVASETLGRQKDRIILKYKKSKQDYAMRLINVLSFMGIFIFTMIVFTGYGDDNGINGDN